MPVRKLIEFLDSQKTKYTMIKHSKAYTAQEVAASAHIPGKEMAKTVIVKIDGKFAMAVLPASYSANFDLLKRTVGADNVELASESEFKDLSGLRYWRHAAVREPLWPRYLCRGKIGRGYRDRFQRLFAYRTYQDVFSGLCEAGKAENH